MNKEQRETVLSKYDISETYNKTFKKKAPPPKKGQTLSDFYREVGAKYMFCSEQIYHGKSADEIEKIMVNNRRTIETKRSQKL